MKQFMINKVVLAAMAALPLFASCGTDEDSSGSENPKALKLHLGIDRSAKTRANNPTFANTYAWGSNTNPSAFGGGETIGIYLRKASDHSAYGFVTTNTTVTPNVVQRSGPYDNIDYKSYGTGAGQTWAVVNANTPVILDSKINGALCAYYPYDSKMEYDGNHYEYNDDFTAITNTIPTNPTDAATAMAINCSKGVDYMYATYNDCKPVGSALNGDTPVLDITMHHAQAVLKVEVSVDPSFVGSANLTDLLVTGGFAMKGTTNITDGTLIPIMPKTSTGATATEDSIHVFTTDSSPLKTLNVNTSYVGQWFMLPINETVPKDLNFAVIVAGHSYTATVSQLMIKRGWIYDLKLQLTNKNLIIHGVVITPWETQVIGTRPLVPVS